MLKHELSYRLFKEVYEYSELEIKGGLVFYTVHEGYIMIEDVISDDSNMFFILEARDELHKLIDRTGIEIVLSEVDIVKNNKWFKAILKLGGRIIKEENNRVLIQYTQQQRR